MHHDHDASSSLLCHFLRLTKHNKHELKESQVFIVPLQ